MALSASAALSLVTNGSFETFTGSSTSYTAGDGYGVVSGWTYANSTPTVGLSSINDSVTNITDTTAGSHWLLVDSRSDPQTISQSLGTIDALGTLSISALIGSAETVGLADFEIGLYRAGNPTALLTLTIADFTDPGLGNTVAASTGTYDLIGADLTNELFVRIQSQDPDNGANVQQTLIDDVNVNFVAVPEPSSAALLGLGGLALILRRRK